MPFPLSSALLPISCWLSKATFQGGQKPLSVFSHVSQESQQNGCAKRIEPSLSPLWLVLPFLSPDSHTKTYIVLSYFHSNLTGFPTPIPPSPYCKFIDLQHCRRTRLESSCHCFSHGTWPCRTSLPAMDDTPLFTSILTLHGRQLPLL